jgi:hypothetical protein
MEDPRDCRSPQATNGKSDRVPVPRYGRRHTGKTPSIVAKCDLELFQKLFCRFCRLAGGMQFDKEFALTANLNLALADASLGNRRLGLRPFSVHFHR